MMETSNNTTVALDRICGVPRDFPELVAHFPGRKNMTARLLLRRLLHTVFPMNCRTCDNSLDDDPIPFFCQHCWNHITPIRSPSCPRCAHPFPSPHALRPGYVCGACRKHPPAYNRAWTPYAYQSPLKEAIGLLKYRGKTQLAPSLARLIAQTTPAPTNVDAILAVPLYPDDSGNGNSIRLSC